MTLRRFVVTTALLISGTHHLLVAQTAGSAQPAIALDGRIDEAEWKAASSQPLEGGGTVQLMMRDNLLYLGIRGPADGIGHVCVGSADEVRILHVSAAVGSAVYRRTGDSWKLETPFSWSLRDTALTGAPADARTAYLQKEGWVGTVSKMGKNTDREVIIDGTRFKSPLRLAVAYVATTGGGLGGVSRWPDIRDSCTDQKSVSGHLPDTGKFLVNDWALVR
jgi:hypothetical protein